MFVQVHLGVEGEVLFLQVRHRAQHHRHLHVQGRRHNLPILLFLRRALSEGGPLGGAKCRQLDLNIRVRSTARDTAEDNQAAVGIKQAKRRQVRGHVPILVVSVLGPLVRKLSTHPFQKCIRRHHAEMPQEEALLLDNVQKLEVHLAVHAAFLCLHLAHLRRQFAGARGVAVKAAVPMVTLNKLELHVLGSPAVKEVHLLLPRVVAIPRDLELVAR